MQNKTEQIDSEIAAYVNKLFDKVLRLLETETPADKDLGPGMILTFVVENWLQYELALNPDKPPNSSDITGHFSRVVVSAIKRAVDNEELFRAKAAQKLRAEMSAPKPVVKEPPKPNLN